MNTYDDLWSTLVLLGLLMGSSAFCHGILPYLPEGHRSRDTLAIVRLVSSLLVTFAALVLGLLTSSVNTAFVTIGNDMNDLAGHIRQTDTCLHAYGTEAEPMRGVLRRYLVSVLASTWPDEVPRSDAAVIASAAAPNQESPELTDALQQIRLGLLRLDPPDPVRAKIAALCLGDLSKMLDTRWRVIAEAHGSISVPFYRILVVMLVAVFGSFGLNAPRNVLAWLTVGLAAVTIAASVFVVLELDGPLDGLIRISSTSMRAALAQFDR